MLRAIVAGLAITMLFTLIRQQLRYHRIRRYRAQDHQKIYHGSSAFHVATFFRLRGGDKLVKTVKLYNQHVQLAGEGKLIYAGQAAFTANCEELPDADWDGILLHEYDTREQFEKFRNDTRGQHARNLFAEVYQHGMRRNRQLSASMPRYLLLFRLKECVRGRWRPQALKSSKAFAILPEFQRWRARIDRLRALHEVNRNGLVVFNLLKLPRAGGEMLVESLSSDLLAHMASEHYGPLHIGRAVPLEGLGRFDRMYIVFYPSALYFAELIASQYFAVITGENQSGALLHVPTVPITTLVEI